MPFIIASCYETHGGSTIDLKIDLWKDDEGEEGILMEINILKEYERVVVDVPESSCNELMLLICLF